ncbi:hypothetical protein Taro_048323 [Colocasia esculenta]|uniref:RNase H type-1 domain-containing protein n=1 Tax=Colocasia esculenta TaxID=4460 RepID=A0A843X534_COLES|nr:hypothetical protein [Colocasia esculenta]
MPSMAKQNKDSQVEIVGARTRSKAKAVIPPILFWNIRGIANQASRQSLRRIVGKNKVDFLALAEPMVSFHKTDKIYSYHCMESVVGNSDQNGKIWIFWRNLNCQLVNLAEQQITMAVVIDNKVSFLVTIVYASYHAETRRILFDELMDFANSVDVPWLIGGDFNCVSFPSEKCSGGTANLNGMAVAVDQRIAKTGIAMVSRCSCCASPNIEDYNHIFINGDLATALWNWFLPLIDSKVHLHYQIIPRIWSFISVTSTSFALGFVSLHCMILMLWEIWKGRCGRRFENKVTSAGAMIRTIKSMVTASLASFHFKGAPSNHGMEIHMAFGFHANFSTKQLKFIRWIPPISHYCLNVDGASKGNPGMCGGGGCIRDKQGVMMAAFSHYYGYGNGIIAEVRALYDGIYLVHSLGIRISIIYTDSLVLVKSMEVGKCPSWQALIWWREAYSFIQKNGLKITHIYREANQVADRLDNFGCLTMRNTMYWGSSDIPPQCKGTLLLDKTGLPHIRMAQTSSWWSGNILPLWGRIRNIALHTPPKRRTHAKYSTEILLPEPPGPVSYSSPQAAFSYRTLKGRPRHPVAPTSPFRATPKNLAEHFSIYRIIELGMEEDAAKSARTYAQANAYAPLLPALALSHAGTHASQRPCPHQPPTAHARPAACHLCAPTVCFSSSPQMDRSTYVEYTLVLVGSSMIVTLFNKNYADLMWVCAVDV